MDYEISVECTGEHEWKARKLRDAIMQLLAAEGYRVIGWERVKLVNGPEYFRITYR